MSKTKNMSGSFSYLPVCVSCPSPGRCPRGSTGN